jgi:lipopolysaccharide heptosyltransferase II
MYYKIINRKKRVLTRMADMIGYALWHPLTFFRAKGMPPEAVKEILVVRTAYIGDAVMTLPMLRPIKGLFPNAKITFLTCKGAEDIVRSNPYVHSVIGHDVFWFYRHGTFLSYLRLLRGLRKRSFDLVIEARGDIRDIFLIAYLSGARHRVSYSCGGGGFLLTDIVPFKGIRHKVEYHLDIARHLGGDVNAIDWGVCPGKRHEAMAEGLLRGTDRGRALTIAIHPGGRKPLKSWAKGSYARLADRLSVEYMARVFFTGSLEDKALIDDIIGNMSAEAISLAGKTDLLTLSALLKRIDLLITNDSSVLHVASAMGAPTVAVFGPSKSVETGPYRNAHRVVEKDFQCRYSCDEDRCRNGSNNGCMKAIGVGDVMDAVKEVLKEVRGAGHGVQA